MLTMYFKLTGFLFVVYESSRYLSVHEKQSVENHVTSQDKTERCVLTNLRLRLNITNLDTFRNVCFFSPLYFDL